MELCVNNVNNENSDVKSLDEKVGEATLDSYSTVLDEISVLSSEVKKEAYMKMLAKKLGVKVSALEKEMVLTPESNDVELCALFPELVDLVEDNAGNVGYLVKQDDGIGYTDSWTRADGSTCYPPERKHLRYCLGNSKRIQDIYGRNEDANELFDDLIIYFKRFSYLPDNTWPIVALCTLLSYMQDHDDVNYAPVLYFHAVAERGKSRTARSFLSVAYRGIHLVDLKTANVFRYSEIQNATMFFDCTDFWKTALKSNCEDVMLGRFEKGTQVSRVQYPERGPFHDQIVYDIFGSTVVATNEPANYIFESRCISITMPNKPGEYQDIRPVMGVPLKERLIAWRARMMNRSLPEIRRVSGISGRLWDITKPLFQLCELVKPEAKDDMRKVLLGLVEKKAEGQRETIEGQIIAAIDDVAEFEGAGQIIIPTGVVLRAVNFGKSERYEMSPQRLGKRLQSLGLHTEISGGYSNLYVSESELALLKEQYGLIECSEISADSNDNEADPDADDDSSMRVVESVESAGTVPPLNVGCDVELEVAC